MSDSFVKSFVKKTTVVCALTAMVFGASSAFAATKLKLAHQFAPDSLAGQSVNRFAETVAKKTDGRITVQVLPGGAMGDERANLQQLSSGSLDIALVGDLVTSYMARDYMLMSMPFIYDSPEHALAVFRGDLGKELNKVVHDNNGITVLGWQYVGTRELTANKEIKTLADLKGLKMRLANAEILVKAWGKTGVNILNINFNELYLALQTGTVEAQENPPNFIRANKFNEVQKYLIATNHLPQMQCLFMNSKILEGLDEADRKAVIEAGQESVAWTSETAAAIQKSDTEWLLSEGKMTLVNINMNGIQDLVKNVPSELQGENGVKLYQRIRQTKY
jgi:tripartite ATP-independent transporter DctP family solute receptor